MEKIARLVAYWLTVGVVLWTTTFIIAYSAEKGSEWIYGGKFILDTLPINEWFGPYLLTLMGPSLLVGMICHLFITSRAPLPVQRLSWIYKFLQRIRNSGNRKMNQWGRGDHGFMTFFLFFVAAPATVYLWGGVYYNALHTPEWALDPEYASELPGLPLYMTSLYFGLAGSIAMCFFLIPVARHNVLLVAVGWSPVHALKLHIQSAYLAYGYIALHGLTYFIYMFKGYGKDGHERVIDQIIPDAKCWVWKPSEELYDSCHTQWWNITGCIAFTFFTGLILTSLHWFRRKYYYTFYMCHVIFGFLGILFSIMHWDYLVVFMFPSIAYYVASTTPVFVQAVASRFRGGVQITEVVALKDAGGCVEVKVAATSSTSDSLDNEVCMVVKMCVPDIAINWHPFTVYKHADDPNTMRFLFRPIGPFTKALASSIVRSPRPVMILDGLYRGGDRVQEALCHDVVTIVCGGVALTPFLSMIPALIQEVKKNPGVTQKLVLHWVCREEGLISYIKENYLNNFQDEASKISNGFELQVIVYHTHCNSKVEPTSNPKVVKMLANAEVTDYDDVNAMDKTETNAGDSDRTPSEEGSNDGKDGLHDAQVSSDKVAARGHAMEPARFMPGLYSKISQNIPQFVSMSALLWAGIVIYTHFLNRGGDRIKILHWLAGTTSSAVWILSCIAFGIFVELGYMLLRLLRPVAAPSYPVTTYDAEAAHGKIVHGTVVAISNGNVGGKDVVAELVIPLMVHQHGRPTDRDIFGGLETTSCPGIFMCGPPGLTQMVRMTARVENSHFGLTRYALYEEPFEM